MKPSPEQTKRNPYFSFSEPEELKDIETLLTLNTRKEYTSPGIRLDSAEPLDLLKMWHSTAGLFRGQVSDDPLIPAAWRDLAGIPEESTFASRIARSVHSLSTYRQFCERAQAQNPSFPSLELERMCIAQHFGVPTPLLDWSQNIFTAVFFSIREILDRPEKEDDPKTFIFHITDERLLDETPPRGEEILTYKRSAFVGPYYADRRIERQRGVFTYHPDPMHNPPKIPVRVYSLEMNLIAKLQKLMEGMGFTDDYYFPDYAGIAHSLRNGRPWL